MSTRNAPALTLEELKKHQDFVYRCVMDNVILKSPAKFGREVNLAIQELIHGSTDTLRQIGMQIEKQAQTNGSSRFSKEGPFKISGVDADKWIDFLDLQIKLSEAEDAEKDRRRQIKALEQELEQFKTPGEKRTEIEAKLRQLNGEPEPAVVAAP